MNPSEPSTVAIADGSPMPVVASRDFAPGIDKAFEMSYEEGSYLVDDIDGQIPPFVRGNYFLNGPARFSRGDFHYRHWLDGDGMVCSLRFGPDGVWFRNRFVRTTKFTAEELAGRAVFRAFGTAFSGDSLKRGMALESPANVSVYPFHGMLLAFGEQALPWQLDPDTLDTVGQFTFGGSLSEISPFAAHPKFDPVTGEMFNFGVFFARKASKLWLYRFDQAGRLLRRSSYALNNASSIHDFGLSSNYAVFYISPYFLDIDSMVRGGHSVIDSLRWKPENGSQLWVIDRHTGQPLRPLSLDPGYCLHLINCFEQDEKLVVDVIEFDRPIYDHYQPIPNLFIDVPHGGPVRVIVDLKKGEILGRSELDYRLAPDFPTIAPCCATLPYQEFWMLGLSATGQSGRKFFDQLVHAKWDEARPSDIFRAEPRHYFGGEPIFVGAPEQRQGVVICQQFDADRSRSEFLIFDAFHVAGGPVASIRLKEPIFLGFHASFQKVAPEFSSIT